MLLTHTHRAQWILSQEKKTEIFLQNFKLKLVQRRSQCAWKFCHYFDLKCGKKWAHTFGTKTPKQPILYVQAIQHTATEILLTDTPTYRDRRCMCVRVCVCVFVLTFYSLFGVSFSSPYHRRALLQQNEATHTENCNKQIFLVQFFFVVFVVVVVVHLSPFSKRGVM